MKRFLTSLLPALFFVSGCSTPDTGNVVFSDSAPAPAARRRAMPMAAHQSRSAAFMKNDTAASGSYDFEQNPARKMSYSTTLSIRVPDVAPAVKQASGIARKFNGYAVYSDNTSIHLKLPVSKAAEALLKILAISDSAN